MSDPLLVVADDKQNIFDLPEFSACGQAGEEVSVLSREELIPLPQGSKLFFLPDRFPVGLNSGTGNFEELRDFYPVAAFVPPGYTGLYTAAYKERKGALTLPLFSYSPVAVVDGAYCVPAVRIDRRKNHDLSSLDVEALRQKTRVFQKTKNRLIRHLVDCALTNFCPNAVNLFLGKYECPLPVSPYCNARCLGCISFQPKGGSCPATQPRLTFVPTAQEVAEVALMHIRSARRAVVSFGQGCEGEPLLEAGIIKEAIQIIRQKTSRGTIHMNTNASLTSKIQELCEAGLDSMRVSLNSAREEFYQRYYLPRGYGFDDVCRSIAVAKRHKKFVFLNYLTMPGFTDCEDEFNALLRFVGKTDVDMIQWRNLNYDPRRYFKQLKISSESRLLGVRRVMRRLKDRFPRLRYGYFNMPKEMLSSPR